MDEDLKTYLEEIDLITDEILEHELLKKNFIKEMKTLASRYEKGELNYKNYNLLKEKVLHGKTKEENIEYYNSYIYALLKKIEYLNTQVFSTLYKDNSWEKALIKIDKNFENRKNKVVKNKESVSVKTDENIARKENAAPVYSKTGVDESKLADIKPGINLTEAKKKPVPQIIHEINPVVNIEQPKISSILQKQPEIKLSEPKKMQIMQDIKPESYEIKNEEKTAAVSSSKATEIKETIENVEIINSDKKSEIKNEQNIDGKTENIYENKYDDVDIPKPKQKSKINIPSPKKKDTKGIIKKLFSDDKDKKLESDESQIGFKGIFSIDFFKDFAKRLTQKEDIISKNMVKGKSILDFSDLKQIDFEKESRENPNLLIKQASQLKEILNKKKIKIYSPSVIGTVSNVTVRKISIMLIDNFPDFFKNFYLTLRYANIKILSNTYINIMVFLSILTGVIFGVIAGMIAVFSNNPLMLILSKVFLMALLGIILCAGFMIYYPNMLIKKRKASINTNLPFAIDHMSSIVASGVSPAVMFKLLSDSKEYGEVSLEIEKISNFVDIFGYDLLTAVKSITTTTPSPQFKEFLDGLVSTIETGGSLKNYLSQKSQEAILSYKLERQKYIETIGTYSDIYTGVLIAAPLFFVSALSLVSVLGGKIGGYDVETIISFGTYVIIPMLNIAFIIFLETNQPEA